MVMELALLKPLLILWMMYHNQKLMPMEIMKLMPELRVKLSGPMFFKELTLQVMQFRTDKETH